MELQEALQRAESWTKDLTTWESQKSFFGVMEALLREIRRLEAHVDSLQVHCKRLKNENEALALDLGLKDRPDLGSQGREFQ